MLLLNYLLKVVCITQLNLLNIVNIYKQFYIFTVLSLITYYFSLLIYLFAINKYKF